MAKSKLIQITYLDEKNSVKLTCYADTLVYERTADSAGKLLGIRFGGYPEHAHGMLDAIWAGSTLFAERENRPQLRLQCLTRQYTCQQSMDSVYAEAMLFAKDDDNAPVQIADAKDTGQTEMESPPRHCYLFTPSDNRDRLFEEIDKRVRVPLIPTFRDYLLDELIRIKALKPLTTVCMNEKFDAWRLTCTADDRNIIDAVERGLKSSAISIPGATPESSAVFNGIHTVSQYLKEFGVTIAERIKSQFVPLFDPSREPLSKEILDVDANIHAHTGYHLYDAQLAAAEGLKRKIDHHDPALLIAECGSGKSKIGAMALYASHLAAGKDKTFNIVLGPSHITGKWCRELEETIPNCMTGVIKGITQFNRFYAEYEKGGKTAFAVISKEKARDGYMYTPAVTWSRIKNGFVCPECHKRIMVPLTEDGITYEVPAEPFHFQRQTTRNHKCSSCGAPLWTPLNPSVQSEWVKVGAYGFIHRRFARLYLGRKGTDAYADEISALVKEPRGFFAAVGAVRRFALSCYIRRKLRGKIDGAILDELHQYNNDSGQGDAMADIARTADKVIGMTATLINGYASGIFHLLYRLFPRAMQLDGKAYTSPDEFNREYGVVETVYEIQESEYNSNRRASRRKIRERQLPGVSPLVYSRFLMENAVFLALTDMGKDLPEYEEIPVALKLPDNICDEYKRIECTLRGLIRSDKKAAKKILSAYMNLLTVYPDQPYGHEAIVHPIEGYEIVQPADLATIEDMHPKDKKALAIAKDKTARGEKVLIYTSWTRIDSQQKLLTALTREGIRTKVLPATVTPEKRELWVQKALDNGLQVLICNPRLVETGLDLNAFTTLVYYNIAYMLFTLRQSSRRSWRINQTAPRIEVYFLYYDDVMQARAISLMASKLAVAGLVEGNFSDEGLAAMSDCRDLTSQLAKELASGIKGSMEDIGAVFKRMAILHPDRPVQLPKTTEQEPFSAARTLPETAEDYSPPDFAAFVFASVTKRRKKSEPALPDENQLSLFDLPKSA